MGKKDLRRTRERLSVNIIPISANAIPVRCPVVGLIFPMISGKFIYIHGALFDVGAKTVLGAKANCVVLILLPVGSKKFTVATLLFPLYINMILCIVELFESKHHFFPELSPCIIAIA
jgi:hypothetical protein